MTAREADRCRRCSDASTARKGESSGMSLADWPSGGGQVQGKRARGISRRRYRRERGGRRPRLKLDPLQGSRALPDMRRPISACKEGALSCCTWNSAIEAAFIAPTHPHPEVKALASSEVESVGHRHRSGCTSAPGRGGCAIEQESLIRDAVQESHRRHTPPRLLDIWTVVFQSWSCHRGVALNRGEHPSVGSDTRFHRGGGGRLIETATSVHPCNGHALVPRRRLAPAVWPGCRDLEVLRWGWLAYFSGAVTVKALALRLSLSCVALLQPSHLPLLRPLPGCFSGMLNGVMCSEHEPRAFMTQHSLPEFVARLEYLVQGRQIISSNCFQFMAKAG
ncbi:hypothetical protein B0T22DRAFT_74973 [Podospora appendiculata]|uniref:Uncharacterized protein n=1 Tax=Podospora appendiculata TaxID=314037 RepID=A0AAE0XJG6_9PEZI|nr:hypothetical protein B0T22DRAFT_74973 [Podospora appendiculata]